MDLCQLLVFSSWLGMIENLLLPHEQKLDSVWSIFICSISRLISASGTQMFAQTGGFSDFPGSSRDIQNKVHLPTRETVAPFSSNFQNQSKNRNSVSNGELPSPLEGFNLGPECYMRFVPKASSRVRKHCGRKDSLQFTKPTQSPLM